MRTATVWLRNSGNRVRVDREASLQTPAKTQANSLARGTYRPYDKPWTMSWRAIVDVRSGPRRTRRKAAAEGPRRRLPG